MAAYRIDELARSAGTTVRNVRAYQDRGLLPPPRLQGRVGLYDESHLARLRLIGQLLGRGYNLAVIADLLSAWEGGRDVAEVLGLEQVLTDPWSDEIPGHVTGQELEAMFGSGRPEAGMAPIIERAQELGFIEPEPDGDRYLVPSPRLLHVGAELVASGIPLEAVLQIADEIRDDCDLIASRFVRLVQEHGRLDADRLLNSEQLSEIAALVRRLRPLAQMAVDGFMARSMEAKVRAAMGDHLEIVLTHLSNESAPDAEPNPAPDNEPNPAPSTSPVP